MMALDLLVFSRWIALIAGVLILIVPRLLYYIVAAYLILAGPIGITPCSDRSGSERDDGRWICCEPPDLFWLVPGKSSS